MRVLFAPSRVLLLGYGMTGRSLLPLLVQQGYEVVLSDSDEKLSSLPEIQQWKREGVQCVFGSQSPSLLEGVQWILVSPGIPPAHPLLKEAEIRGIPVFSDIDFVLSRWATLPFHIIAVTGTEGKSTTTSWIAHLLRKAGKTAEALGNIGIPVGTLLQKTQLPEWIVLEISSFQLLRTHNLIPDIAVVLNIRPDHLDWHKDFEEYCEAKMSIFRNQSESNWAVLNADSEEVSSRSGAILSRKAYFSLQSFLEGREGPVGFLRGRSLILRVGGKEEILVEDARELPAVPGKPYVANALASILAAHLAGVEISALREGLRDFSPLPHRMEWIGTTKEGIQVYNDSKATTPLSALAAISSLTDPDFHHVRPVTVILGGAGKNLDYSDLIREASKRCFCLILTGSTHRMFFELSLSVPEENCESLIVVEPDFDLAVRKAFQVTPPGGVVLLSPSCTSFDRFRNFEERGEQFRALVEPYL
ncbi:MAG: UDP-N-acetylmuramoyl-L-alanine--D-glutamate ligase [bacterium JZ-2024 1]